MDSCSFRGNRGDILYAYLIDELVILNSKRARESILEREVEGSEEKVMSVENSKADPQEVWRVKRVLRSGSQRTPFAFERSALWTSLCAAAPAALRRCTPLHSTHLLLLAAPPDRPALRPLRLTRTALLLCCVW